jgi:signal transduction histidine kinase
VIVPMPAGPQARRFVLLEAAAPSIGAILDRAELLEQRTAASRAATGSSERQLARLRYDLHDGPQQDVILLADDIRLFRDQLQSAITNEAIAKRVLGRLDDFDAQLVALDGDLRRLSASLGSPFLLQESCQGALERVIDGFAARASIEPQIQVTGDLERLTASQQLTLLALVREALSNIRDHSCAHAVTIQITATRGGVEATIVDDGRGFEPETTLIRAARGGHLGLVSMHERVRLLGGVTKIESRPGGPTVVSAKLPPHELGTGSAAAAA